jgi:hypothetical protein
MEPTRREDRTMLNILHLLVFLVYEDPHHIQVEYLYRQDQPLSIA